MGLPGEPVTISVAQIAEMQQKLSTFRHDVNNQLSLIMAAVELMRNKPQLAERMLATMIQQPPKISQAITQLSADFEALLKITRP